jgi:glutamate synthase domain-containing protein 1
VASLGCFLKDPKLEPKLGAMLTDMLITMTDRGPDSAGIAIYSGAKDGLGKITVQSANPEKDFKDLDGDLQGCHRPAGAMLVKSRPMPFWKCRGQMEAARSALSHLRPDVKVMSAGDSIEIFKEVGLPKDVAARFDVAKMKGTHGIGHTRMATESAVTTMGAHPFSTGSDQCLVHNGSLSNHNGVRRELKRLGMTFETENDTEVAAAFISHKLRKAKPGQALEATLTDLDGFFTFVVGTKNGFGVVRDPIACKPAVMAETDQYVAFGSEYRALVNLPGIEDRPRLGARARHRLFLGALRDADLRPGARGPARAQLLPARPEGPDQHDRLGSHQPQGRHAIAVGVDAPVDITVRGSTGYYCAGMNKQATIRIKGSAGPGVAENMMSGTVIIDGDASQYAGATGRGGLLVIKGNASPLRHLDEGHRHRRAWQYRPHVGLHGAVGQSGGAGRCRRRAWATRSTRRGFSCAAR